MSQCSEGYIRETEQPEDQNQPQMDDGESSHIDTLAQALVSSSPLIHILGSGFKNVSPLWDHRLWKTSKLSLVLEQT